MESEEINRPLDEDRRLFLGQCRSMLAGLAVVGIGMPLLQGCETERVIAPAGDGTLEVDVASLDADGKFLTVEAPGSNRILVVRTGIGSYTALSMLCTHEGCTVDPPSPQVMVCPCHASEFNLDGSVRQGPAQAPLKRYAASQNPTGKLVITL